MGGGSCWERWLVWLWCLCPGKIMTIRKGSFSLFPLLVHSFFVCLSSLRSSCISQARSLPEFLVFLYNRVVCSWALIKFPLKISQLSWAPFPFMAVSQGTLPSNSLKISQSLLSWHPESKSCCFSPQPSFGSWAQSSYGYCNQSCQPWLHFPLAFHSLRAVVLVEHYLWLNLQHFCYEIITNIIQGFPGMLT